MPEDGKIKEGDHVLIVHRNKSWLLSVKKDQKFQTHISTIDLSELIGKEYGEITQDGLYYVFKPTLIDHIMKFERGTQIVYPKDAAYTILKMNIGPGSRVLELGTGSGAMTAYMANFVRPNGEVQTFDVNEEYIRIAKKNIEKVGLSDYVKFGIFNQELNENYYDAAFVDLGDPWKLVELIWKSLKPGSMAAFLLPTYNQLEKLYSSFEKKFYPEETVEIMVRRLQVAENRTRPQNFITGHTAFLTFCRKIISK